MEPITLTQHILQQQRLHPEARGSLTALLTQLGVASKIVSSSVRKAGLAKVLGKTEAVNVHGEVVQQLDELANRVFINTVMRSGHVAAVASEEERDIVESRTPQEGDYVVAFDPLDGSSNIAANISIGSIFGIYRKCSAGGEVTNRDFLRPGSDLVAAGYAMYGAATVFVYSTGQGVHGFTLDPEVGEFVLSDPEMTLPAGCNVLSVNEANAPYWSSWTQPFVDQLLSRNDADKRRINGRHIGSLVADFHRNLRYGGIFLYPEDRRSPRGKLRCLYEAFPLAFLIEQAGGYASDGRQRMLDIVPTELHQRTPLIIGNRSEVELAEQVVANHARS